MNRLAPVQGQDGRWTFCRKMPTGVVTPIGYCQGHVARSGGYGTHRYHDNGHETAEEAARCYHRYVVEQEITLVDPPAEVASFYECAIVDCPNFTAGYAETDGWKAFLCASHRTRDRVASIMPVSMEIWTSQ